MEEGEGGCGYSICVFRKYVGALCLLYIPEWIGLIDGVFLIRIRIRKRKRKRVHSRLLPLAFR